MKKMDSYFESLKKDIPQIVDVNPFQANALSIPSEKVGKPPENLMT